MGQNVLRSFGPQNFYGRSKFVLKLDHPWVNALNGGPRHLALSFIPLSLLLNFAGGIEIAIDIDPSVFLFHFYETRLLVVSLRSSIFSTEACIFQ